MSHTTIFDTLGFAAADHHYPLKKVFGMVVGEQNSGKTFLFQSCPDAFILNLDASSTVNANAKATTWPGIDKDGELVDVGGTRILSMTWEMTLKKIEQLVLLAKNNADRPSMVVFDTMNPMYRMVVDYISTTVLKCSWDEYTGYDKWSKVNNEILRVARLLRQSGYGVWFIAHLTREWAEIRQEEEYKLAIPKSLREALSKEVELIAPVFTKSLTKQVETTVKGIKLPNGKQAPDRKIFKPQIFFERTINFDDPRTMGLVRRRTLNPIPPIELQADNPWTSFEEAYDAANIATN